MRKLRLYDWEALVVVIVAMFALGLHLLGYAETGVVLTVIMVALAILLIRDLGREARDEALDHAAGEMQRALARLEQSASLEAVLLGPRQIRQASESFARRAHGEITWFNVCLLMFRPQPVFDLMLLPAIENPNVSSIQFVLDEAERDRWEKELRPKIARCPHAAKVGEPRWRNLRESISFVLCEQPEGAVEAQLSFWGEPFMSRVAGSDVPRFVFELPSRSQLLPHLIEMERRYRLAPEPS